MAKLFEMSKLSEKCKMKVLEWVQHNPKKWDKAFYSGQLGNLTKKICKRKK